MHTCTMYDSIQDVPPDVWGCLVTEVDFAMEVVVRDGANEPAAIACLARFDLEIVNLHGWQRRGVGAARQLFRSSTWNVRMFFKEGKKEAVAERE